MRKSALLGFIPPRLLVKESVHNDKNVSSEVQIKVENLSKIGEWNAELLEKNTASLIESQSTENDSLSCGVNTTLFSNAHTWKLNSFRPPGSYTDKNDLTKVKSDEATTDTLCFSVIYTKKCTKKRKSYTDGVLVVRGGKLTLFDSDARQIYQTTMRMNENSAQLTIGSQLDIGSNEIEICNLLPYEMFLSGKAFVAAPTANIQTAWKLPKFTSVSSRNPNSSSSSSKAMFDPNAENALVLCRGNEASGTCDVVVDPALSKLLRPHQREGIKFLFECVTGMRSNRFSGRGCVLADEMGLGKTLQSIALIWTMIKQGPSRSGTGLPSIRPFARKAIIVCPASLVDNWGREIAKFLGPAKLTPISITESGLDAEKKVKEFITTRVRPVLIISYETFRKHAEVLNSCAGFELLICDEGHRLKSAGGNKTIDALSAVPTDRRIILTGTPLQNHLDEFFSVISFVNPLVLGRDAKHFKRVFQHPIERGRDKSATREEVETADARSKQLSELTEPFVLRRTSDVNRLLLPPKRETTLFVRLTQDQVERYLEFLQSGQVQRLFQANQLEEDESKGGGADALRLIMQLKQLCTHPLLLDGGLETSERALLNQVIQVSGKFIFLDGFLKEIRSRDPTDRVVLVSCFTSTLDLVSKLCELRGYPTIRLDGTTKVKDRQFLVNRFNSPESSSFVFLLSSKAGGCGINLIGANRLILIDPDWNPATDLQAMARIWRDGQKKPVFVYRLLSTGTIEERIYQRQILKTQTANGILKGTDSLTNVGFSRASLKCLFDLRLDTDCDTYDLLEEEDCAWDQYKGHEDIIGDEPLKSFVLSHKNIVSWVQSELKDNSSSSSAIVNDDGPDTDLEEEDVDLIENNDRDNIHQNKRCFGVLKSDEQNNPSSLVNIAAGDRKHKKPRTILDD